MLSLDSVGVLRGEERWLRDVSLATASTGLLCVVGPGGAGKSSLLTALSGSLGSGLQLLGEASLDSRKLPLPADQQVHLPQHCELAGTGSLAGALAESFGSAATAVERMLLDAAVIAPDTGTQLPMPTLSRSVRRLAAVLATLCTPASLYLLDEPTADMDSHHAALVRDRIRQLARTAMVILVTHNRQDCLRLGGTTALLAGGTLQDVAASMDFFGNPQSAAARTYVETGNCGLSPAGCRTRESDGIWWLQAGLLAGMSRPGMVASVEKQGDVLRSHGVSTLICLEERRSYPTDGLRSRGLSLPHFPVADLAPPSFDQALDICRMAQQAITANQGVALHCRGGLGRTGTGLAAILIWMGDEPDSAIRKIRSVNQHAIQTPAQERFLGEFASRIQAWH